MNPPRLTQVEAEALLPLLAEAEWSRVADDWPLPAVDLLEQRWAEAHGAAEAVAVSSGTAGLTLALRALELPPGDEVLIPAFGCPALDVAVLLAGLTPIHVDLDRATYCLSPAAAAAAVTARTAALIAVHFAGQAAHREALARVAARHGLAFLDDACLAPGLRCGDGGTAAVFSLGVRKPISAGEGGLVVTDDPALAQRLRRLRGMGADAHTGEIWEPSGNYRLSALQAAAALPQLARLDADIARRRATADRLTAAVAGCPWLRPLDRAPWSAWAQYWLRFDEDGAGMPRERLLMAAQREGLPLYSGWRRANYSLAMYTPVRAVAWLRERGSGRSPEHYERACCPHAEHAAYSEAVLLDFPTLQGDEASVARTAEALQRLVED